MPSHLQHSQGIAVGYYNFTLGSLEAMALTIFAHLGYHCQYQFVLI